MQFVFKTSEKSPLGALALGKLVVEAGFPPGVINFISGGPKTGQLLASHMDINKISFTGSAAAGRKVQEAAAKSNLKRVTLELGGKSPSLIFNDADIEIALATYDASFLVVMVCSLASSTLSRHIYPALVAS
jgi:aldehyde dehydrogenase (NAD+)